MRWRSARGRRRVHPSGARAGRQCRGTCVSASADGVVVSVSTFDDRTSQPRRRPLSPQIVHTSKVDLALDCAGRSRLATGGWCLKESRRRLAPCGSTVDRWVVSESYGAVSTGPCWAELPGGQSYAVPPEHKTADPGLIHVLDQLLSSGAATSVLDIGSGVGQYGRALLARNSSHRWTGCDAPDASRASGGFVRACDVTEPLWNTLPTADWVISLEVAEHIPRAKEASYLRNLHMLNCLGLIVSWATPGQGGTGHINERWTRDAMQRVGARGYAVNHALTRRLRDAASLAWFSWQRNCSEARLQRPGAACNLVMGNSLTAYDRINVSQTCGAQPKERQRPAQFLSQTADEQQRRDPLNALAAAGGLVFGCPSRTQCCQPELAAPLLILYDALGAPCETASSALREAHPFVDPTGRDATSGQSLKATALWRHLLERAPGATGYVKLDTDTWVINLPLLLRAVEGALRPKSTDGEHRRGVWGKCTAELTLKPSSRYYERKNKSGVFMGNTFEHRQRLCE